MGELDEYEGKRDFARTSEPASGDDDRVGGRHFVVQKHDASQLHYDFRLAIDGVLKSWAVPKGPSMNPKERRLAVPTEDHPLAYGTFEGVIPEGQYGGGTVLLWDRGTFAPIDSDGESVERSDAELVKALGEGKLRFRLDGEKLRGGFTLVRMKGDDQWLLIKRDDDDADRKGEITGDRPESVLGTGGLEDIAAATVGCVRLTHPDKVLYPDAGLTKRDLAEHFERVAERMLPHLARRPLTLVRCPEGIGDDCFFQKHAMKGLPSAVKTVELPEKEGTGTYLYVEDAEGLVVLAQLGTLELHVWGSHIDRPERVDRLVFDLDPGEGVAFAAVVDAARDVRDRLHAMGLTSFPLLTGGAGIHVVVPLERYDGFDEVRAFAAALAKRMAADDGDRYIAKASKSERKGRIFIDYLRNGLGATAIAPYSPRAREGAPVAVPLRWDELGDKEGGGAYTVSALPRRLSALKGDPWDGYDEVRQRLTQDMKGSLGLD
jgi:bifunctional non-homologous end joining protein LigD